MKHALIVATMFALYSCATAQFTEGARKVRLVTESPQGCEYLGEIFGSARGAANGKPLPFGGVWDLTHADLKNKAAEMGADTVQVLGQTEMQANGEAYKCNRAPASK